MAKQSRENLHDPSEAPGEDPHSPSPTRLAVIACAVLEDEIAVFAKGMDHIVHVHMMEQGLHNEPDKLRAQLQIAIDAVEEAHQPDAIVLVYGLCSRGTEGVRARNARLVIARAQDCITHLLGSKEDYAAYVKQHPGTYWYSPGWNKHHTPPGKDRYDKLLAQYTEKYGQDNAEYLMEAEQHWFKTYDRAAYVTLTVNHEQADPHADYTEQCADWLGWKYDHIEGDPQLLIDLLAGNWDNERFVVLEPGQSFELCADERVIQPVQQKPTHVVVQTAAGEQTLDLDVDARSLADQLAAHDIPLNTRCDQKGICDGCLVSLVHGSLRRTTDNALVEAADKPVELKACEHRVDAGAAVTLRVPDRSRLGHQPQVVNQFKIRIPFAHDPMPVAPGRELGIAVDVGTTTVVVMLVDLTNGKVLVRASAFNAQVKSGDNVLTRINLCCTDPKSLPRLQKAVAKHTLVPLIRQALEEAEKQGENVGVVSIAANTTMLHLLAGVDPSPMGIAPFTPNFIEHRTIAPGDLADVIPVDTPVHLLPGAAAYVGADLVAGMCATGLIYDDGPALLIDIGTNGEMILRNHGSLVGCATAAGPAFEGAGLRSGARAGAGAISHASIDLTARKGKRLDLQVIGETKPNGICGSAYIDLLAEARRVGLLNANGRFVRDVADEHGFVLEPVPNYGLSWRLAGDNDDDAVHLTETDIASLLQAKAAIASGIITLLDQNNLTPADLRTIYIAGGFGLHLNVYAAMACGLLPHFDPQHIQVVGNTSLAGAYLAMIDHHLLDQMTHWAARLNIIELNLDPEYESRFIEHLPLPAPVATT